MLKKIELFFLKPLIIGSRRQVEKNGSQKIKMGRHRDLNMSPDDYKKRQKGIEKKRKDRNVAKIQSKVRGRQLSRKERGFIPTKSNLQKVNMECLEASCYNNSEWVRFACYGEEPKAAHLAQYKKDRHRIFGF